MPALLLAILLIASLACSSSSKESDDDDGTGAAAASGGGGSGGQGAQGGGGGQAPTIWDGVSAWETPVGGSTIAERIAIAPDDTAYVLFASGVIFKVTPDGQVASGNWPLQLEALPSVCTDEPTFNLGIVHCRDITTTADGNLVVVRPAGFGWRISVYDTGATQLWEAEYDAGGLDDLPHAVTVDSQDRIVVVGNPGDYVDPTTHLSRCNLVRYSASGDFDDSFEVDLTAADDAVRHCSSITSDASDAIYVASMSVVNSDLGLTVRKIDAAGNLSPDWNLAAALGVEGQPAAFALPDPGQMRLLPDGGLVAALNQNVGSAQVTSSLVLVGNDGSAAPEAVWDPMHRRMGITATSGRLAVVSQPQGNMDLVTVNWYELDGLTMTDVGSASFGDNYPYRVLYNGATGGSGDDLWFVIATDVGSVLARITPVPAN